MSSATQTKKVPPRKPPPARAMTMRQDSSKSKPPRPPPPSQMSVSIKGYSASGRDSSTSRRSSSTESANSLPDSDEEELPPLILADDKSPRKEKKSKEKTTEKPKPVLPERPKTKPPPTLPLRPTQNVPDSAFLDKGAKDKLSMAEDGDEKDDEHKKAKKKKHHKDKDREHKHKDKYKDKERHKDKKGDKESSKKLKHSHEVENKEKDAESGNNDISDPTSELPGNENNANEPNTEDTEEEGGIKGNVLSRWKKVASGTSSAWISSTSAVSNKTSQVSSAVSNKTSEVSSAVTNKTSQVSNAVTTKTSIASKAVSNKTSKAATSVSFGFSSVVMLAKKAALDTKHKMVATEKLTLIHFNDVYNVDSRDKQEPVGGAARMRTAIKQYADRNPLILFSGDCFAPSILSTYTKGEQMIPVLNKFGTHCAVFGNHDFDFGIDTLMEHAEKTDFPWLMSNVIDNETGRPLAEGKVSHVVDWWGRKIGLIGLVEKEWLDTLSTINPEEVTYTDFVDAGTMLARELKKNKNCEIVIALTHMRTPNDVRLAENVAEIDLILGGHDHVYEKKKVNGTYILKSGTDFRQFSTITLDFSQELLQVDIESVDVTSEYEPDNELSSLLEQFTGKMEGEMCKELGEFEVDLDGRFSSIRTMETNLGNFVCDIMVASTNADFALLNSGTLRSDTIHPAGPFFLKDLLQILPMIDPVVLLEVTGPQIIQCLENSVSQWPKLEGRFPQVSGINFAFDPNKPAGKRINPKLVKIGDEYVDMGDEDNEDVDNEATKKERTYRMATKSYLANGKDGYDVLANAKVLIDEEDGPQLTYAVQNHFKALAMREGRTRRTSVHHQSLVTISRRQSVVRALTADGTQHLPAHMPEKFKKMSMSTVPPLIRLNTIGDFEMVDLAPKVEGRIRKLDPQALIELMKKREKDLSRKTIFEIGEEDEVVLYDLKNSKMDINLPGEDLL